MLVRELRLPAVNPLRQQIEEMPHGAKVIARPDFGTADAIYLAVSFLREHRDPGHQAFLFVVEAHVGGEACPRSRINGEVPAARLHKFLLRFRLVRRCQCKSRTTVEVRQQPGETVSPHAAVRAIASHVVNKNQPVLITKET